MLENAVVVKNMPGTDVIRFRSVKVSQIPVPLVLQASKVKLTVVLIYIHVYTHII